MQRIDQKRDQKACRSFRLFRNSIHCEQTFLAYSKALDIFCNKHSLSYDDIIKLDSEDLHIKLENWIMDLNEAGLRHSTIRTQLAGIEKFLDSNRKLFHKPSLHSLIRTDKDIGGGNKPFTNEDIQKMLLHCSNKPRTRALILFLSSTGIRPSTIEDPILRKKHLVEMQNNCYAVKVYDNSKEGYWTFLTPEARKALDDYLQNRKFNGEDITLESPLFVNFSKHAKGMHLTVKGLHRMLDMLYHNAKIQREKIGNRFDKAMTYGFRKRFNTILKIDNNVNSNIAEKLMGHKRGLDGAYLTPTIEQCFNEFKKAIPELTITNEGKAKLQIKDFKDKKETELTVDDLVTSFEKKEISIEKIQDILRKQTEELVGKLNPILEKQRLGLK